MPITDHLSTQLDRLAEFDSGPFPVVSLYLNLQPDEHGRDRFEAFLRKELDDRLRTYPASGPERQSLEQDFDRIRQYVQTLEPSANGVAIFACSAGDLFEAIPLAAAIDEHRLYISDQPHLYPIARLLDEYPRYVAVLADTHTARIFVCAGNQVEHTAQIEGVKTRRHKMGGWSQARYQRHTDNFHVKHAKEVVEVLERLVREERIDSILLSGDDVIVPLLKEQFPKHVAERVVDVVRLDTHAPERDVIESTMAALRAKDAETDRERVDALLGAYRANGLACVGVDATRRAFELGQVDELLITATPATLDPGSHKAGDQQPDRTAEERAADDLIVQARQTSAKIRFIEDPSLLAAVGGVGAFLRFKI